MRKWREELLTSKQLIAAEELAKRITVVLLYN
jgi:hypothetical protein